jgi:hypothetical protein
MMMERRKDGVLRCSAYTPCPLAASAGTTAAVAAVVEENRRKE